MLRALFAIGILVSSLFVRAQSFESLSEPSAHPLAGFNGQDLGFNANYDWSEGLFPRPELNQYGIRTHEQRLGIRPRSGDDDYINHYVEKRYQQVNVLTVDTRDEESCYQIAVTLRNEGAIGPEEFAHFCDQDSNNPYVSVAVVGDYTTIGVNYSDLSERGQNLARQTRNFFVPAVGMMAILYALPRDFTGWERFNAGELADEYVSNVTEGPEIEDNKWYINWIGHPYSGAAYYVVARHAGFSRGESFAYSAFMSTFFWEYGVEAVSEVPSIQDLIITPTFGALLGEAFIAGEQRIRANGGQVLGSRRLGNVALNLMDPAGWILEQSNRVFEGQPFDDVRISVGIKNDSFGGESRDIQMGIHFLF